ncbi:MAG: deoxyhypusine synthase [Elusimicrobia bacterium GWA2_69_24]|nr:MAG: deoxyhypusine synthase [Elusimicrobia bacterium GWA2_69_24]HBL17816.1 deoxyhypusine synthase [Elusimicrobiota bacterium]
MPRKSDLLKTPIEHIDITKHNTVPLVDAMSKMAFSARDLARASRIYDLMLADKDCGVILCLAGSLISAGLKRVIYDLVRNNMVDAIVSTGANIVDQDFFEALGYKHYLGTKWVDDKALRATRVDRIYDTFIDEDELGKCDSTISRIADGLEPRPYSSREFLEEMGKFLVKNAKVNDSIVLECFKKKVPIFVPAFSDCSAGFGLLHHQWHNTERQVTIDSAKDFRELVRIKLAAKETGLLMIGGGVPKNFAQDVTVGAEMLGLDTNMHKYAVQITVADERDGALSGSTLREACSWGKVDTVHEQMVFSEATLAFPILAGYAYHKGSWKARKGFKWNALLDDANAPIPAAKV